MAAIAAATCIVGLLDTGGVAVLTGVDNLFDEIATGKMTGAGATVVTPTPEVAALIFDPDTMELPTSEVDVVADDEGVGVVAAVVEVVDCLF